MSIETDDNRVTVKAFLCLLVCSLVIFLAGLGRRHLWDADEPRVAGITTEMAMSGDWIVPKLNGKPFLEKPPMYYWIAAPIFNLLGGTTFSVRIPSALAAIGGLLLVFVLAHKMGFSHYAAFTSVLVLATFTRYWGMGRKCVIDMMLCLFTTGAMVCLFIVVRSNERRLLWGAGFVLSLSCAILTKGLVGLVIPLSAIVVWLVVTKKFSLRLWIILLVGSILSLVPAGIWFWRLSLQLGAQTAYEVMLANNLGRFSGGYAQHVEPFYYYILKSPPDFLPWLLFVPIAIIIHFRRIRHEGKDSPSLFVILWFVVPSLLLSISAGKRFIYMLPLFPAAALFIGTALAAVIEGKEKATNWFNLPSGILVWTTIVASLGLFFTYLYYSQPFTIWLLLFIAGACFGLLAERKLSKRDFKGFLRILAPALISVFLAFDTAIAPVHNKEESFEPLFSYCKKLMSEGYEISLLGPKERVSGAAVFYLGKRIPEFIDAEEMLKFLELHDKKVAVINEPIMGNINDIYILKRFTIGNDTTVLARLKKNGEGPKLCKWALESMSTRSGAQNMERLTCARFWPDIPSKRHSSFRWVRTIWAGTSGDCCIPHFL